MRREIIQNDRGGVEGERWGKKERKEAIAVLRVH